MADSGPGEQARPCPFYSQGRCLFADSCNFIHTVKSTYNDYPSQSFELDQSFQLSAPAQPPTVSSSSRVPSTRGESPFLQHSRPSSARSVLSPPRSPRLSGLLFALQSVIGPDEEEDDPPEQEEEEGGQTSDSEQLERVHVEHPSYAGEFTAGKVSLLFDNPHELVPEEDNGKDEEDDRNELVVPPAFDGGGQQGSLLSPFGASFEGASDVGGFSFLSDFPVPPGTLMGDTLSPTTSTPPRRTFRSRLPSPIITQQDSGGTRAIELDSNALEIYSHANGGGPLTPTILSAGPQTTFELLSSPFASPAKRIILSPHFPASNPSSGPTSPIFGAFPNAAVSTPVRRRGSYLDDELDSPSDEVLGDVKDIGISSDFDVFRTPKNVVHRSEEEGLVATAKPNIAPLLPSITNVVPSQQEFLHEASEADFTITAVSQYDESPNDSLMDESTETIGAPSSDPHSSRVLADFASSFSPLDEILGDDDDDEPSPPSSPVSPTVRLADLQPDTYEEQNTLNSVVGFYSSPDPSPINSEVYSSETFVDSDLSDSLIAKEKISATSSKRSSFASLSISIDLPQKSTFLAAHSPLREETRRTSNGSQEQPLSAISARSFSSIASSASSTSSKPTWSEISRKVGGAQKVPFGFRQSVMRKEVGKDTATSKGRESPATGRLSLLVAAKLRSSVYSESSRPSSPYPAGLPRDSITWMRPLRLVSFFL